MSDLMKAIHASRRQLVGLEDEEIWRSFLEQAAGGRSLRAMPEAGLRKVLAALRARGAGGGRFRPSPKAHVRKVFALWGDMRRHGILENPTRAGLRGFVARMTATQARPEGVGDPDWLTPQEAAKVVEGLKAWRGRVLAKQEHGER
ncbi:regulatory protein GemA [Neomegalonema sp.]|uniref:regulatory protein GemA n=1 Tax=Neomegalonema sp. TaxID=2039713 RepID=UPI00260895C9|nr:regulatory protein GemA [Neomegalonema sp.]MDD2870104.1 regulatory protein GemA [Neomegalonema sp.]